MVTVCQEVYASCVRNWRWKCNDSFADSRTEIDHSDKTESILNVVTQSVFTGCSEILYWMIVAPRTHRCVTLRRFFAFSEILSFSKLYITAALWPLSDQVSEQSWTTEHLLNTVLDFTHLKQRSRLIEPEYKFADKIKYYSYWPCINVVMTRHISKGKSLMTCNNFYVVIRESAVVYVDVIAGFESQDN